MKILRIFNNNVVLARDESGRDLILTGRGLGFQARPGQEVDRTKVVREYVAVDGPDAGHLAHLLSEIPPEQVRLVSAALTEIGLGKLAANPALVIALADHVNFALRRVSADTPLEYPLLAEVKNLYSTEYAQAQALLAAINVHATPTLPPVEATALALHLVNAGFAAGDLSYTYTMTGVIQQLVSVIEQTFDITLDHGSVNVGRFVTHLRYLFVRIHQHRQLDGTASAVGTAIREAYPRATECAQRVAGLIELRLGSELTQDEVSYLALHMARVTLDAQPV